MRWNTRARNERQGARFMARYEWHPWFAWYPVTMHDDSFECRWLVWVQRRMMPAMYYSDYWVYKP